MNHETQRLLVAASRGARVQGARRTLSGGSGNMRFHTEWVGVGAAGLWGGLQRIHPEDVHLQYGPVSTELRRAAETGKFRFTVESYMARDFYSGAFADCMAKDSEHFIWLCAFAAELAADAGM